MEDMNKINSIQNYIGTYSFEPKSDDFTLDQLAQKSSSGKHVKFGEYICVGSTLLIFVLLFGIWVIHEIKESDV